MMMRCALLMDFVLWWDDEEDNIENELTTTITVTLPGNIYPSTFVLWLQAKVHNEEFVLWLEAKVQK